MQSSEFAQRYRGETATHYEVQRTGEPSWVREQAVVSSMLDALPRNASVIDVPVGTGRFFEFYHARGLRTTGIDVSADMLAEARHKAAQVGLAATLQEGDIRELRFPDGSFDGAVCIRLLNLIPFADAARAILELARVSKRHVILGVRYFLPARELARTGRLGSVVRQAVRRVRARASSQALRIHPRAVVLDTFGRSGLTVVRSELVEGFPDGSELVVYLLQKAGSPA